MPEDQKPTLLQIISGRSIGGAEKLLINLAQELRARGYPIVVACPPGSWTARRASSCGIPVETFPMKGLAARFVSRRRLHSVFRKYGVRLVHTHMRLDSVFALPEAARAGIPSVCTMHNTGEELYCRMARATIAVSEAVKSELVERGMPDEDVFVVPPGIDLGNFRNVSTDFRRLHHIRDTETLVGVISRFTRVKALDVLLRAISSCPNVKLALCGYGKPRYERHLRRLARDLGVSSRAIFAGPVDDPAPILSALNVYALSSYKEGLPQAMLEAMASGVPVVATRVGGVPEVITHEETGLLVPPGDAEALAGAINRLASDRALAERLAAAARQVVVERYKVSDAADAIERIYAGVLAAAPSQRDASPAPGT